MQILSRRQFMKPSVGAATAMAVLPGPSVSGANERIILGVMHIGGRGIGVCD